ncbi:MAG TPA: ABC transporter transmembrane domain-containing protein, partial [Anaerolineae bacterium]
MRRLLGFLKPHWPLVLFLAILNLALAGLMTVAPIVTKAIVDNVIDQKQINLLPGYLVILFGVAVARAISQYFYGRDRERLGQLIVTDIRTALYKKLLALSYSFYDNEQTGRIMSRITSDVDSTRMFLAFILVDSVLQVTVILAMLIALLTLDATMAAV